MRTLANLVENLQMLIFFTFAEVGKGGGKQKLRIIINFYKSNSKFPVAILSGMMH